MTKPEIAAKIAAYRERSKPHVSPAEAAEILGCYPYSLNVSARNGHMPKGSYFFAGRNLRISLDWLESYVLGGAEA